MEVPKCKVVQNSFDTCDVNQFNENTRTEFGDAIIHEPHEITEFTAIIDYYSTY